MQRNLSKGEYFAELTKETLEITEIDGEKGRGTGWCGWHEVSIDGVVKGGSEKVVVCVCGLCVV